MEGFLPTNDFNEEFHSVSDLMKFLHPYKSKGRYKTCRRPLDAREDKFQVHLAKTQTLFFRVQKGFIMRGREWGKSEIQFAKYLNQIVTT